jgi:hypothetical protein
VTDVCRPRHPHSEFLAFLELVAKAYPRRQLHIVVDIYATPVGAAGPPGCPLHPHLLGTPPQRKRQDAGDGALP